MINIRPAKISDAQSLLHLFSTLESESDFMLMEPGERSQSLEQQRTILGHFSSTSTGLFFIAEGESNKGIIGFIVGKAGTASRNRHCISLVIGILQSYSGKGLGKQMIEKHLEWSSTQNYHRIELTVMSHNEQAIRLYKSCLFEVEGTKRDALKINGKYVDELYMSRILPQ